MKQPLPQVVADGDGSADGLNHWKVQETEHLYMHAARTGKVVVIHRPEDNVAPLQQLDAAGFGLSRQNLREYGYLA